MHHVLYRLFFARTRRVTGYFSLPAAKDTAVFCITTSLRAAFHDRHLYGVFGGETH
jgi:hypothetical protein